MSTNDKKEDHGNKGMKKEQQIQKMLVFAMSTFKVARALHTKVKTKLQFPVDKESAHTCNTTYEEVATIKEVPAVGRKGAPRLQSQY